DVHHGSTPSLQDVWNLRLETEEETAIVHSVGEVPQLKGGLEQRGWILRNSCHVGGKVELAVELDSPLSHLLDCSSVRDVCLDRGGAAARIADLGRDLASRLNV